MHSLQQHVYVHVATSHEGYPKPPKNGQGHQAIPGIFGGGAMCRSQVAGQGTAAHIANTSALASSRAVGSVIWVVSEAMGDPKFWMVLRLSMVVSFDVSEAMGDPKLWII